MSTTDWSRFLKTFQARNTHWYVSKIKSYDLESLKQLQEGLRLLKHWFVDSDKLPAADTRLIQSFLTFKRKSSREAEVAAGLIPWTPATELFFCMAARPTRGD